MTREEAEQVAAWRYDGSWSVYDLGSPQSLIDNLSSYSSVLVDGVLVGFCCVGEEARVAGMAAEPGIVDFGIGLDPAMVGQGHGTVFGEAVLHHLRQQHPDAQLRAVVQAWNERSLRLTRRLGFADAGERTVIQNGHPVTYRIVVRQARRDGG